MKAHLCKCNNCDTVLIDENPQIGAKELELTGNEVEMEYIKVEGTDNHYFWACLICKTDDYLTDL